jgi:peptidoglycan hydrolase-like protein with peptidoglycan-binding domain
MRRRHSVSVTRASAASIMASLALLCVPTLGLAAERGDSRAEAADATTLSVGAGYGQAGGESRVRALQRRLRALGHRPGPVDGLYGPRTKAAVERLQRHGGLSVNGIAGPQTLRLLNADAPPLAPRAGIGQPGGSRQVREIQRRLRAQGARPGPVDGLYGPRTEAAVERFQRSAGVPATGVVSRATAVALARTESARPTRASETPGSDKPQRAAERAAGGSERSTGSEPSTTRPPTVVDGRTDVGEEAGSTFPVPLVALALALAASGGLLAVWLTRRRPRPDSSPAPVVPLLPAPTANGNGKPAYHGNGAMGNGKAATRRNGSAPPSTREPHRPRDGAVALGNGSAAESDATALAAVGAAAGQRRSSAGKRHRDPAPDALEVQERIRAMRAGGTTLQAIADRLNAENVPALNGGTKWRPSTVQQASKGDGALKGSAENRGRSQRPTPSRNGGGHR